MSERFTPAQEKFLHSLDEEPGVWAECDWSELRTAESLVKRGLVEIHEQSRQKPRFEARTTSVQPNYNNGVREMPFGKHMFVMARPIRGDWQDYDGTTFRQSRQEFRPCMIRGHEEGQRIYVIGSAYSYDLSKFEIREIGAFTVKPIKDDLLYKILRNGEADSDEQADAADWLLHMAGQQA